VLAQPNDWLILSGEDHVQDRYGANPVPQLAKYICRYTEFDE